MTLSWSRMLQYQVTVLAIRDRIYTGAMHTSHSLRWSGQTEDKRLSLCFQQIGHNQTTESQTTHVRIRTSSGGVA